MVILVMGRSYPNKRKPGVQMSIAILSLILLAWTVAGLLSAIAFGKAIKETSGDEESLAKLRTKKN